MADTAVVVDTRPTKKLKTSHDVAGEHESSTTPISERPLADRILALLPILEAHKVTPADLVLEIVKSESRSEADPKMQKCRDDLYGTQGNSWSKLFDILEAVTESKKGLKDLKRWLRAETAEEIITDIVQGEMDGDGESEEEDEEDEEREGEEGEEEQ